MNTPETLGNCKICLSEICFSRLDLFTLVMVQREDSSLGVVQDLRGLNAASHANSLIKKANHLTAGLVLTIWIHYLSNFWIVKEFVKYFCFTISLPNWEVKNSKRYNFVEENNVSNQSQVEMLRQKRIEPDN